MSLVDDFVSSSASLYAPIAPDFAEVRAHLTELLSLIQECKQHWFPLGDAAADVRAAIIRVDTRLVGALLLLEGAPDYYCHALPVTRAEVAACFRAPTHAGKREALRLWDLLREGASAGHAK